VRQAPAAIVSKRAWLIALALLAVPLLAGFNARLVVTRQLFEEEARLQREIEAEEARATFLKAYAQYVQSDEFVERWARGTRMAKPGEIAVVPEMPVDAADASAPLSAGNAPRDFALEWWAAFFASEP